MTKRLNLVKCRECKQEILEHDLRIHWEVEHLEKLRNIDLWLGRTNWKWEEAKRLIRNQEGMEYENKQNKEV